MLFFFCFFLTKKVHILKCPVFLTIRNPRPPSYLSSCSPGRRVDGLCCLLLLQITETLAFQHKHRNAKLLCNHHILVTPIIGYTTSLLVCIEQAEPPEYTVIEPFHPVPAPPALSAALNALTFHVALVMSSLPLTLA